MRLHRFLVPLAAAIVLMGIFVALGIALSQHRSSQTATSQPLSDDEVAELLKIKNEAEALAIADKLPEAHAKYRELFTRAQGRDIKDPAFWDLIERAKDDQARIYLILLAQHDPARILTPPLPATNDSTAPTTAPATTQSFVDRHPPYAQTVAPTIPGTSSLPKTRPATSNPANAPATAPFAVVPLPEAKHLKIKLTPVDPSGFSDESIGQSLALGNDFLLAQFRDGEITQGKELSETYRQGLNALVVYALLHSGEATHDPRLAPTSDFMRQAIEKMKLQPMATDTSKAQQPVVYARSLRAAVLARGNRPDDREVLKDDVQWLIAAAVDGAYTYDDRFTVKVIKADPNSIGHGGRKEVTPLPGANPDTVKPKTLGPTRSEPDKAPGAGKEKGASGNQTAPEWVPENVFGAEQAPVGPLSIQLADGLHDPRTGRELGWPPKGPRGYPPPAGTPPTYPPTRHPPPIYPPGELPEKYGGTFVWDNSNSQYGLLGVWSGAEVGMDVPDAYWAAAQKHWLSAQLPSGEWSYRKDIPGGRLAMTAAGIASLYVTHDYLEAPSVAKVGRQPSPTVDALNRAFGWLEKADNAIDVTGPRTVYLGYTLHALSRVGLASGYKYFGTHDWYRALARKVVQSQWESGAWGRRDEASADTLIDTAYSMLFLARGRHPIIMNKLRLDEAGRTDRGEWNNRPRDLANLARFASRELERPLNWQIVSIDRDPADWSDAPILYLASHAALKFTDAEIAKIRAFCDSGGMLFTQADGGSESFNLYIDQLAKRLFPQRELKEVSPDDEIYSLQYIIPKADRPRLRALSNGSRVLWVHSPTDLAVNWQQRAEKTQRAAFEMGVNLFVYAAGKVDLRNRLDDRAIPAPSFPASSTIALARLKYDGNWDPEPHAWSRFARYFQWQTSIALQATTVDLAANAALNPADYAIAHLSGTSAFAPTDAELKALHDYVAGGGTLIAEAVGGASSSFADSLQSTVLPKAFPEARFEALPLTDPMLHASFAGMEDVWKPLLRGYALQRLGKTIPPVRAATVGKGRVIYLPLDVTTGLLGSGSWPIFGYEPGEAQALMKNILLWTAENSAK